MPKEFDAMYGVMYMKVGNKKVLIEFCEKEFNHYHSDTRKYLGFQASRTAAFLSDWIEKEAKDANS